MPLESTRLQALAAKSPLITKSWWLLIEILTGLFAKRHEEFFSFKQKTNFEELSKSAAYPFHLFSILNASTIPSWKNFKKKKTLITLQIVIPRGLLYRYQSSIRFYSSKIITLKSLYNKNWYTFRLMSRSSIPSPSLRINSFFFPRIPQPSILKITFWLQSITTKPPPFTTCGLLLTTKTFSEDEQ